MRGMSLTYIYVARAGLLNSITHATHIQAHFTHTTTYNDHIGKDLIDRLD